jgi:hypothetical protein
MAYLAGDNGWKATPPAEWESIDGALADSFGAAGRLKVDSAWINFLSGFEFELTSKRITRLTPFNTVPIDTTYEVIRGDYERHGSLMIFRPDIGAHFFGSFIGQYSRPSKLRLTFDSANSQIYAHHADFHAVVPAPELSQASNTIGNAELLPPDGEVFPIHTCDPRSALWLDSGRLRFAQDSYEFLFSIQTGSGYDSNGICNPSSSEQVSFTGAREAYGPVIKFSPDEVSDWPFYGLMEDSLVTIHNGPFRHYGPWNQAVYLRQ